MKPVLPAVTPSRGSLSSACMAAQAMSPWLASSLRLAWYVAWRPDGVIAFRIAMKLAGMSV